MCFKPEKEKKDKKHKKSEKKSRKRSPSLSETVVSSKSEKKEKKSKRAKANDDASGMELSALSMSNDTKPETVAKTLDPSPGALDNFDISSKTKEILIQAGVPSLFPIQAMTYDKILAGKDLMGRARTGMGKTLAFALPVVELLLRDTKQKYRKPRVICMTPTRELARQVASEFERITKDLRIVSIYGGTSYQSQNQAFRSGVDILVGTTGRVIDHIDRGNLQLDDCKVLILDEADTMLEMGFREDVQKMFSTLEQRKEKEKAQILLFSATIPKWVKDVANKYMHKNYEFINLVKDSDDQASTDVQHIAIPCHWQGRPTLLASLLGVFGSSTSRTIIFAETKKDCNELSVHPEIKQDCQVLHGDIAQDQRETTMKAFRESRIRLLIATDVAARGLDMNVDLVINSEPPRKVSGNADVDTYVHRSGRTGRAGKKGICITLYTPRQRDALELIERQIGNKFVMRDPPSQDELIKASAVKAFKEISQVDPKMIAIFEEKAQELLESTSPVQCLAAALACITGHTKPPRPTSIMSGAPDYVTVQFSSSSTLHAKGYVWNAINRDFPEEIATQIKQLTLTDDSAGACFDLPVEGLELLQSLIERQDGRYKCPFSIPTSLPKLQQSRFAGPMGRGSGRGMGRGGRGRGYGRKR